MLALAATGESEGLWLRAVTQTGGRGRLGRRWESPPGNLYASTLVRLRASDPSPPTLAFVAAVGLYDASAASLRAFASSRETKEGWFARRREDAKEKVSAPSLQLKWPNDLMLGDAKLAGILLERAGDAVVIGIGVNLAHAPVLDRPTAAFPSAPDPAAFLEDLATTFARWLVRWRGEGFAPVRQAWLDAAHPRGTGLATPEGAGLFDGLSEDGALLLRLADGSVRAIHAGDVFLA